jgi:hypothetical protein
MRTIADQTFQFARAEASTIEAVRLERCSFAQCSATECTFRKVELLGCRTWSCSLYSPTLEDCRIDGGAMTVRSGRSGRRSPLFLWGGTARHVTLHGTFGGIVWNPPKAWGTGEDLDELNDVKKYYEAVDWALDIREARFTSSPTLRFGPPGRLILRDPKIQPLVTRAAAEGGAWRALGWEVGVWRVVLEEFVKRSWPEEIALIPSTGKKAAEDLAGLQRLRELGVAQ